MGLRSKQQVSKKIIVKAYSEIVKLHTKFKNMSTAATLNSTHLPGQLLELASVVQAAELADLDSAGVPKNDNIQISFDTEEKSVTITATLPVISTSIDGGVSYTAQDYLP